MPAPSQVYALPPFAPASADILCGLATSPGGTIITIPAGRVWQGVVTLSGNALVAIGGGAANASVRASTAGANVSPTAGDYVRLDLGVPAAGTALAGAAANGTLSSPMLVAAPAGNSATLVLNSTGTNTQSASAIGFLL